MQGKPKANLKSAFLCMKYGDNDLKHFQMCITVWKIQGGKAQNDLKVSRVCEIEPQLKSAELFKRNSLMFREIRLFAFLLRLNMKLEPEVDYRSLA